MAGNNINIPILHCYNPVIIGGYVHCRWTAQRVEEYFLWSAKVVRGLRKTDKPMEAQLDKIFERRGVLSESLATDQ